MTTLAIQTAVGDMGSKATTTLSLAFNAFAKSSGFQYGVSANGIFLLNTDSAEVFSRSFTLATSDFQIANLKRCRRLYFGVDTTEAFTVTITADDRVSKEIRVTPKRSGYQQISVSVPRTISGRYITVKISTHKNLRVSMVEGLFIVRPRGLER